MPVMPKLEHYNQNAMRSMAAAALATKAAAANARARPRLAGQCENVAGQAQYPKGHTCSRPLLQMPTKSPQSRPTSHAIADAHVRSKYAVYSPLKLTAVAKF